MPPRDLVKPVKGLGLSGSEFLLDDVVVPRERGARPEPFLDLVCVRKEPCRDLVRTFTEPPRDRQKPKDDIVARADRLFGFER